MNDPVKSLGLWAEADPPVPAPRSAEPMPRPTVTALTVLGALSVGFLIAVGVDAGRDAAQAQDERRGQLIALVHARNERVEGLAAQLERLRDRVAQAEELAAAGTPALRDAVADMEQAAGLSRLRGPGVLVTLEDAGSSCRSLQPQDCRIQDVDLQLTVNTLFGLGAEGIAVNGERVISTTAIRNAGRSVLVNYRVLAPPYLVEAVGDPDALADGLRASQLALDFEAWKDAYGLGFTVERVADLLLPSHGGSIRLREARIAGGAGQ